VPTRLLDFSRNALKAAYFAAEVGFSHLVKNPECKDNLCVWAVNLKFLSKFTPQNYNRISSVSVPRAENEYLHGQEGLFIYDTNVANEFGKTRIFNLDAVLSSQEHAANMAGYYHRPDGAIIKLMLPIAFSKSLLQFLDKENINKAFLMPTFDNVVSTLHFNRHLFGTQYFRL
jgi:hypothetical protein